MADSKLTALSEISVPNLEDLAYTIDDPSGAAVSNKVTLARLLGQHLRGICGFRLTTETGVPVSTSDRTAQSTIYLTPDPSSQMPGFVTLHDGTRWKAHTNAEISLALSSLTSGKNYDVFVYDNAGTLALELSAAWTNDTTRADAIALQNSIYVKSGTTTRRYVGTIRTTSTTTTEDSLAKRFVWSHYNRVRRFMKNTAETTNSWTYTTATFRQANANTANQLDYVVGMADVLVEASVSSAAAHSPGNLGGIVGVGVDSTSTNSATHTDQANIVANALSSPRAFYSGYPGLGRHFLAWIEAVSAASGTMTWGGDYGGSLGQLSGIRGWLSG